MKKYSLVSPAGVLFESDACDLADFKRICYEYAPELMALPVKAFCVNSLLSVAFATLGVDCEE